MCCVCVYAHTHCMYSDVSPGVETPDEPGRNLDVLRCSDSIDIYRTCVRSTHVKINAWLQVENWNDILFVFRIFQDIFPFAKRKTKDVSNTEASKHRIWLDLIKQTIHEQYQTTFQSNQNKHPSIKVSVTNCVHCQHIFCFFKRKDMHIYRKASRNGINMQFCHLQVDHN